MPRVWQIHAGDPKRKASVCTRPFRPYTETQQHQRISSPRSGRGELPSLRAVKTRMHVGTDRARAIRDELVQVLREAPEAA